ncbi:MAG TPA: MarR family winged helix-turn-helix transcriptional regulator [Gemmatimonadaceae bacterium]|nr:MarR family winged helix-turn-helix transcriptional regulator [Gemmatimonadaceae bacterium]
MTPNPRDEIKQAKPFTSLHAEAELNIIRTSAELTDSLERLLAPFGLSGTQYNALRILRGAEPTGLCRNELRDRMLTRMPDVTRLLDRMEAAGLVRRARDAEDRRLVTARITEQGCCLLDKLHDVMEREHYRRLGHLSDEQLRMLSGLLTLVRHPG